MSFLRASDIPPRSLHAAFGAAFADYLIGPLRLALGHWPRFLVRQGIDLTLSRAATGGQGIAAFALTAPRETSSWRLGTMGAVPAARGSGAAPALLDDFIVRAAAAGQAQVELECFAQNERGLRLYRGRGFEPLCALYGYTGSGDAAQPVQPEVQPVPLADAYAVIDAASRRRGDLPLQVTPASLRAHAVRLQAWGCGPARVVAGESAAAHLTLYSLVDEDPAQLGAERLVRHLMRCFPAHALYVPQLQRDDLGGGALLRLGLRRLPLHQMLMRRAL